MTNNAHRAVVPKSMTGIAGLDEITKGGLPQGRTTLIIGSPGAGKTILSLEFLYRGAAQYGEPGVYVNFGDPREKVLADARTFFWDLDTLMKENRLIISNLKGTRNASWHDSGYKIEALLEAIAYTVRHTGAKRVALDDTDLTLPGAIPTNIIGSDLKKLMRGIEGLGVTLVMSSVAATGPQLSCSMEEYLADCVISLEHKIVNQVATRRLRIKKYRGTDHGVHEYPFQITSQGMTILPVSTLSLSSTVSDERVSSGIAGLDYMLSGGYYRESAVLISGGSGTGKSNLAMSCLNEGCKRGERGLYVSYEESPAQLKRNFLSVGINVEEWEERQLLGIMGILPEAYGGEEHHSLIMTHLENFHPTLLVLDSLSALNRISSEEFTLDPSMSILTEAKNRGITVLATVGSLNDDECNKEWKLGLNCFADTILQLQHVNNQEETRRGIMILKSRGMKHSSQLRELLITDNGLKVGNTFFDQSDFVMGVARQMEELKEKIEPSTAKADYATVSVNKGNGDVKDQTSRSHLFSAAAHESAVQFKEEYLNDSERGTAVRVQTDADPPSSSDAAPRKSSPQGDREVMATAKAKDYHGVEATVHAAKDKVGEEITAAAQVEDGGGGGVTSECNNSKYIRHPEVKKVHKDDDGFEELDNIDTALWEGDSEYHEEGIAVPQEKSS